MLKRVLEVVVRIEDNLSYLRERMPLAGLSGTPAGTWWGFGATCGLRGTGLCCFSSMTDKST